MDMPEDNQDIERRKFNLELEKFHWQKATQQQENNIFNRNFGVIITAIISGAAIVVSYLQLTISSTNAQAQIENERLKNDRQFYFEIAKFLLEHRTEMEANDDATVAYLKNVVVSTFPRDVGVQIATRMRDTTSDPNVRAIWNEGLKSLQGARAK